MVASGLLYLHSNMVDLKEKKGQRYLLCQPVHLHSNMVDLKGISL